MDLSICIIYCLSSPFLGLRKGFLPSTWSTQAKQQPDSSPPVFILSHPNGCCTYNVKPISYTKIWWNFLRVNRNWEEVFWLTWRGRKQTNKQKHAQMQRWSSKDKDKKRTRDMHRADWPSWSKPVDSAVTFSIRQLTLGKSLNQFISKKSSVKRQPLYH